MTEIIGTYNVPERFVGASDREILEWARNILNGQEPKLTGNIKKGIREGRIKRVFLEPKTPGTFLPDGSFVEALAYTPTIGDDFAEAEKEWDKEAMITKWIKEENERFNKKRNKTNNLDYWEHGRRIVQFADQVDEPTHVICRKMGELGVEGDYGWLSHSLHVDFYYWKPNIRENDPVLRLTWKTISDILMFGRSSNEMKDFILEDLQSDPFNQLKAQDVYLLLNGNLENYGYPVEDKIIIDKTRRKFRQMAKMDDEEKQEIIRLLKKK